MIDKKKPTQLEMTEAVVEYQMKQKHDIKNCGRFHCWCCDACMNLKDAPSCKKCKNCTNIRRCK